MGRAVAASAAHDEPASRTARRQLVLASCVLAAWLAFLAHQAYWHANPVVVSGPQILVAPLIVEGELREGPLRVLVTRVWRGEPGLFGQELELAGEVPPQTASGAHYLVPLRRTGERYQIEPATGNARLFYPADDHVRRQVERLILPR